MFEWSCFGVIVCISLCIKGMESYIVLNFLFKMFFRKVKVKVLVVVEVVSSLWFKILKVIE